MSRFSPRGRHGSQPPTLHDPEDQTIRQYRFLLHSAPTDALEAAHREALPLITTEDRADVLHTVQRELVAGEHLTVEDHDRLAHLVTLGERRTPGCLTSSVPQPALRSLAQAVIDSEAAFGLFGGYAAWDGVDPVPPEEHDDSEYGQKWHGQLQSRRVDDSYRYGAGE